MYSLKNFVENAVNSKDHLPFLLQHAAFDKLPSGTVETLLKPENKKLLKLF